MHIYVIWFGYFQHWWERLSIIKTASFNDWTIENVILPWKPEKLSSPKLPFFVFLYSHSQTGKWTAGNVCIYVRNQLNTTRNSTLNRIHLINFQIVMLRQKFTCFHWFCQRKHLNYFFGSGPKVICFESSSELAFIFISY